MNDFTLNQLVIFAARSGNIELLKERVNAGGNVNYIDEKFGTALIEAIRYSNIEVIDFLIANGVNVNVEYRDSIGPLEIALRINNPEIVNKIVIAGAKLKHRSRPYYKDRLIECLKTMNKQNIEK